MGGATDIAAVASEKLSGCSRILVFDKEGQILYSNFEANPAELPALAALLGDRGEAISNGLTLQGKRYEVHRHYPPLVYGRQACEDPANSEGVALCAGGSSGRGNISGSGDGDCDNGGGGGGGRGGGADGWSRFAVVTYALPLVSARVVPQLQEFVRLTLD